MPIPPHTRILGPFGGDALRYAARIVGHCSTIEEATLRLRQLASQYDGTDPNLSDAAADNRSSGGMATAGPARNARFEGS